MWGDILSTMGLFSTVGDIMTTIGGYLEYHGGYHNARRGDIPCTVRGRGNLLLFKYPYGNEHPPRHDISPCIMISPHSTQITIDDIPPQY